MVVPVREPALSPEEEANTIPDGFETEAAVDARFVTTSRGSASVAMPEGRTPTSSMAFLAEFHDLRQVRTGSWLLCGDFSMIYRACDKNTDRLNYRLMGQVRRFLNEAALKEILLQGRLFTWREVSPYSKEDR
jgi:hypothetical protein